ncbi:MAG: Hsp33 family molecular chaperone HslO [Oscillospiraceae bacterium]|nr:Hsp33 family molecular chaperone HslO [Oscillospiraceae bacterium]
MADEIVRIITQDGWVRASAITGKELVTRAREIHDLSPTATAALGRSLLAASMLGSDLKGERDTISLQFKGDGPIGAVCAVSDSRGNVRGYVGNPHVTTAYLAPGKLNVGAAVGRDGFLTVVKDLGLKEPYVGSVPLVSGEIAEDVTVYLATSEQIPSAVALGVLVNQQGQVEQAGGYMIQLLPGAPEEVISAVERGIQRILSVTEALSDGLTALDLLAQVLGDLGLNILETQPVAYRCNCTRDRVERALLSLGRAELQSILEEQGEAELNCQFCDAVYHFDRADLEQLISGAEKR